jgi:5-methylcytosine-specific restriction endonuclease McrA
LYKPWTEGRWRAFVTSALRSASRRYPPKYETLNDSKTEKKVNVKTGRLAQHYRCAECNDEFVAKDVEVDHIRPVIDPKRGFTSWDDYINRLFCDKKNMQTLCKECHLVKTKQEKDERKEYGKTKGQQEPAKAKPRATRARNK